MTTYNERSWAIDLIAHIKTFSSARNRAVKNAGGEQTIRIEGGSLYPDVLLYGNTDSGRILQGWELKFPDTSIDDVAFYENAKTKAQALGLNSFILWNVTTARLYVKNASSDIFEQRMQWGSLSDVTLRSSVAGNRNRTLRLVEDIISYVDDMIDTGVVEGRQFIEAYKSGGLTHLIVENSGLVAQALLEASRRDANLEANMTLWWSKYYDEYALGEETDREEVLAQANISNWIGKLLFANILRDRDTRAGSIVDINEDTTPQEALEIFRSLSHKCNFWTIFSDEAVGLSTMPDLVWRQLKEFNRLLIDIKIGAVDQEQLSKILEATVDVAKRKLKGQYTTPNELARLLVAVSMRNPVDDRVLDPCSGSGTIVRAVLEQKLNTEIDPLYASSMTFAGDQDPYANQIATFALARPDLMHVPLRVFNRNVFSLSPEMPIDFRNPSTGEVFTELVGRFDLIVSNPPFVSNNERGQHDTSVSEARNHLTSEGLNFTERADTIAYVLIKLHELLAEGGRVGIITTNAWLGTEWGDDLYDALQRYFKLRTVITSGSGRWFGNAQVVTNILIIEKRDDQEENDVNFMILKRRLEDISDSDALRQVAALVITARAHDDVLSVHSVNTRRLRDFRNYALGGSAQFVNCDWVLDLPLVKLGSIFTVRRGERGGMNDFFYPEEGHGIETEYIHPLIKNMSGSSGLSVLPTKEVFLCDKSIQELQALGHVGTLAWIRRFGTDDNIKKLSRGRTDIPWYSMRVGEPADMLLQMNPFKKIFIGRPAVPAYTDQRLVCLNAIGEVDIELCHALLNSTISLFFIEGIGFGRGEGVLDLNKERLEQYMPMLDIGKLTPEKVIAIKKSFAPLLNRDTLEVADELDQPDRQNFDDVIIDAFGLTVDRETIYACLRTLVGVRLAATT